MGVRRLFSSKIKDRIIIYARSNTNDYQNFKPAKLSIPEWYKKIPRHQGEFPPKNAQSVFKTVKACSPFLDSLITGYVITTSQDLVVSSNGGSSTITWATGGQILDLRNGFSKVPAPTGFYEEEFVWRIPVTLSFPKNHSLLITHPLNRYDLPFMTLSGIVDAPFVVFSGGNLPFFLKKDFEGIIPQGTPIAQVIPFKHDNWFSQEDLSLLETSKIENEKSISVIEGWYRKTFWVKKTYN